MLLEAKVAVITGGGRGIGRAIALKFAAEGAAVVVAARTKSEIESVAKEVREAGGRAAAVAADVADEKQCEHLIREAASQFGRVDILVNNAGEYGPVKPVEEISPAEWDRVIAVHLRGAYLLDAPRASRNVRARLGSHPEHFEPVREVRLWLGLALRGGQGGHAGSDARGGRRSGAQGRARQRHLPRPGHGNKDVKGLRTNARASGWEFPRKSN